MKIHGTLELDRKDAIKMLADFQENLKKRMLHRPELLMGTKDDCKELIMNLNTLKELLKDATADKVIFFCSEWDVITLPKKRLKVYLPGGKKYWEEFMYMYFKH